VTAAELLAEIRDCRARCPTRDTLAADAGQAAVAIESGKRKTAFRWGCNKRLCGAFCTLADSTRHRHPRVRASSRRSAPTERRVG
jgi:Transposase IS116/IS110/IS902 family